jgi:hypothetical protein
MDVCLEIMPKKRSRGWSLVSIGISSFGAQCAEPLAHYMVDKKPTRFRPGEKKEFQRFQRRAKKVGLLVSQDSYKLYFRDPPAES